MNTFQKPRGTVDIYQLEQPEIKIVMQVLESLAIFHGFYQIITPTFESEKLFCHGLNSQSDLVSKEMYLFKDRKNRELALRPEGTLGIIRAILENK
jgi:histidyl-tRNA synthetase